MGRIFCAICKREAQEVSQDFADLLAKLEGRAPGEKAYECSICEAMIYESELVDGRFVPKQPRRFWM